MTPNWNILSEKNGDSCNRYIVSGDINYRDIDYQYYTKNHDEDSEKHKFLEAVKIFNLDQHVKKTHACGQIQRTVILSSLTNRQVIWTVGDWSHSLSGTRTPCYNTDNVQYLDHLSEQMSTKLQARKFFANVIGTGQNSVKSIHECKTKLGKPQTFIGKGNENICTGDKVKIKRWSNTLLGRKTTAVED